MKYSSPSYHPKIGRLFRNKDRNFISKKCKRLIQRHLKAKAIMVVKFQLDGLKKDNAMSAQSFEFR